MKRRNIKTFSVLLLLLGIFCIDLYYIKVEASEVYDFENITEEESLKFLYDHNIEIPIKYRN